MKTINLKYILVLLGILVQYSCQTARYPSYSSSNREEIKPIQKEKFLWGINGHSLRPSYSGYANQYLKFSYEEQIELLKQLNMEIYRVDVHVNEKGIWNEKEKDFTRLVEELHKNDIELLPVIFTNPWRTGEVEIGDDWDYNKVKGIVEANNKFYFQSVKELDVWEYYYDLAYRSLHSFTLKHGDKVNYYHIGNEIAYYVIKNYSLIDKDNKTDLKKNVDYFFKNLGGDEIIHFFQSEEHAKRIIASAAYVSGMIDGIKAVKPEATTVVNGTRIDYGYMKLLNMLDVDYDVIGWNWYSNFGPFNDYNTKFKANVYQELVQIGNGKPIWITELNKTLGSYYGEDTQFVDLKEQIDEIYDLPKIESIIVYELIDMDYENPDWAESYFGLLKSPFQVSKSQLQKPAFDVYRFKVQEKTYGDEDFVNSIKSILNESIELEAESTQLLKQFSSLPLKEAWINELFYSFNAEEKEAFENKYNSKEELKSYIESVFKLVLNRTPTKRESNSWTRKLKKAKHTEQIWKYLFLTEEFYENSIWDGYEKRTGFDRPVLN